MNADSAGQCRANILVGPTAVGKTAVAHALALSLGMDVLSADSMVVYRGMDIGTAKPSPEQRAQVHYWGLDLVAADVPFNVSDYLDEARRAARAACESDRMLLVSGGTGLYVRCLVEGLDASPPPNPELRAFWDRRWRADGLPVLQEALREQDPTRFDSLSDSDQGNPRRLIRAIEVAAAEAETLHRTPGWGAAAEQPAIAGLAMDAADLDQRIAARVHRMYADGLIEEVERLVGLTADLPAANGIGVAEARGVLDNDLTQDAAIEKTIARTRKLARRQMTWFRHQANVFWITIDASTPIPDIADRVRSHWERVGPVTLPIEA